MGGATVTSGTTFECIAAGFVVCLDGELLLAVLLKVAPADLPALVENSGEDKDVEEEQATADCDRHTQRYRGVPSGPHFYGTNLASGARWTLRRSVTRRRGSPVPRSGS